MAEMDRSSVSVDVFAAGIAQGFQPDTLCLAITESLLENHLSVRDCCFSSVLIVEKYSGGE